MTSKYRNRLTDQQKIDIADKYKLGTVSYNDLGREYGFSGTSIGKMLKRRGIPQARSRSAQHRIYSLNEHYFDVVDTEEKAYFLGLLYADGCNVEKVGEIVISLQDKDKHILEDFSIAIGTDKPLSFKERSKKNPKWRDVYCMSICSKIMSLQLSILGCFEKKSLTLKFPTEEQVPSHLIRHFTRGYFDGDGSISTYKLKNRNRYQTVVSFVSTLDFSTELAKIFKRVLDINCRINKRHKDRETSTRQLTISGNNVSFKVMDWLYDNATVFFKRKNNKFHQIKKDVEESNKLPRWEEYAEGKRIRIRPNGTVQKRSKRK